MNKKLLILFLVFFIVCMTIGSVSASHTYHKGKYSFTVSDSQYKKIKHCKNTGEPMNGMVIKTKYKKTVKVPKYKNKKVTKTKWKSKKMLVWKDYYDGYGNWLKGKSCGNPGKYLNHGWKYKSSVTKTGKYGHDGNVVKYYNIFKKKVKYKTTKKVQTGYKKVKLPIKVYIKPYTNHEPYPYTTYHPQMQYIAEGKVNGELYRDFGDYYRL
ncbi:hypothetical protein [uncultured Methanobrevibacter sp.]|uniref:hypothetical protein n=1 Tax=uncultured Methanobrevibacter sp. TaxID=253161 RepID=UPI0025F490D4|nr:hypothetical protein [uncultured Methanobrevibacter sp.]